MKHSDSLYAILRGMIREEIDHTPGFRQLTSRSTLPANVDAERSILGAILLDNHAYNEAAEKLRAEDFALDSHQRVFARMSELIDAGRAVDIVTLAEELRRRKEVEAIGGVAYLASLTEGLPRGLPIAEWAVIVKEKGLLRQILKACSHAMTHAMEQSTPAAQVVEQLGKDLKGIRKDKR